MSHAHAYAWPHGKVKSVLQAPLDINVTGAEPFPVAVMFLIITTAAQDLTVSTGVASGNYAHQEKPINQQLYLATFDQFLMQLQGASNATLQAAFAEALYTTIYQATFSGNLSPDLVPSLSALSHSAGFDDAIAAGFLLVSL